jgi:hypothetical protein
MLVAFALTLHLAVTLDLLPPPSGQQPRFSSLWPWSLGYQENTQTLVLRKVGLNIFQILKSPKLENLGTWVPARGPQYSNPGQGPWFCYS